MFIYGLVVINRFFTLGKSKNFRCIDKERKLFEKEVGEGKVMTREISSLQFIFIFVRRLCSSSTLTFVRSS